MTIKELMEELKQYDENTRVTIAHYGMQGVITEVFDVDIVGNYTTEEIDDKYVMLG